MISIAEIARSIILSLGLLDSMSTDTSSESGFINALFASLPSPTSISELISNNYVIYYHLAKGDNYTEAYRKHIDTAVEKQNEEALGGWGTGIGKLQFDFLKEQGMSPDDRLLDLGCGTLRGGRFSIAYLKRGNYTGMDLSEKAIDQGKELVGEDIITENDPTFVVNQDLQFDEFEKETFDWILAQSVFTHLKLDQITECLSHITSIMTDDTSFYATYFSEEETEIIRKASGHIFAHDVSEIRRIAGENDLTVRKLPREAYPHPRGQKMIEITLR